jgi:hypothetical protein
MSQPPAPSTASSVLFARAQYDGTLSRMGPLREAMAEVSDKPAGLFWAKYFGEFMVRRSFFVLFSCVLTVFPEGSQGLCGDCGPGCRGRYPGFRDDRRREGYAQLLHYGGLD